MVITPGNPPLLAPAEAARLLRPGQRALIAGCGAEPAAVLRAVAAEPALWQGVHLTGAWIPGVNETAYGALGRGTVAETIFATAALRGDPRLRHLPLHYTQFWDWLARPGVVDVVYARVPPMAADGSFGLGIASDFSMAAVGAGARLVGLISPAMPDLPGTPRLPAARFAALVADDTPLITYDAGPVDAATHAIAQNVLSLLRPGDTIQLGLGKVQAAVLGALTTSGLRDMGFHAGMISAPILPALRAGIFGRGVTSGVALGDAAFYAALMQHPVNWSTVEETHSLSRLAAIPDFVSINSILEIDLGGQANAETLGGRQISGQGGLVDFLRGARASAGGRAILALSSTAAQGRVSRIVPRLAAGATVTVPRAEADIVVTEHGIARLSDLSLAERAAAMIALAAPQHRDTLAQSFSQIADPNP